MNPPLPAFIIADTHDVYRYGLANLLKEHFKNCTVAHVTNADSLLQFFHQQFYDVVLMDAGLPPVNGFEAARNLIQLDAGCRLIMYAYERSEEKLIEAFAAGATAFFYSDEPQHDIIFKVSEVLKNGYCILHDNIKAYRTAHQRLMMKNNMKPLTLCEKEVLQYIIKGLKNKEIAATLHRSEKTICSHRHNIMTKAGQHNTAQLLAHAKEIGWI